VSKLTSIDSFPGFISQVPVISWIFYFCIFKNTAVQIHSEKETTIAATVQYVSDTVISWQPQSSYITCSSGFEQLAQC